MKADFFNKEFNLDNISHAYLFECKDSNESHKAIDNFIKKILCTSNRKKNIFCDECKSCKSFNGNSNPDYLQIFPDDKDNIGIGSLRGDYDKNRGIISVLNETSLISKEILFIKSGLYFQPPTTITNSKKIIRLTSSPIGMCLDP